MKVEILSPYLITILLTQFPEMLDELIRYMPAGASSITFIALLVIPVIFFTVSPATLVTEIVTASSTPDDTFIVNAAVY